MTAIYIPPPPPPVPSLGSASFSGQLETAGPGNAGIMQKAVYMPRTARIGAVWVSGVDGLDGEAAGSSVIRFSDHPWDRQEGAAGFDLALPGGESQARTVIELTIPACGWLYIFINQAAGGHWGAQVGFEILWQESMA